MSDRAVTVDASGPRFDVRRLARRHGWTVVGRSLAGVEGSVVLSSPADAARLLPAGLAEGFDTAELAAAAGIPRRLAQQMTYCLRGMGALEAAGTRRRAILHRVVT